jgi:hypothetical protein
MMPLAILFIYFLTGNRNKIFYVFLFLSFVLSEFDIVKSFLSQNGGFLEGGLEQRIETYTRPEYAIERELHLETRRWFLRVPFLYYYLSAAFFLVRINKKEFYHSPEMENIFSFILLFWSFVNFFIVIPSGGLRFQKFLLLFFSLYLFLAFARNKKAGFHWLTKVGIPFALLTIITTLRVGFESMNLWLLGPTPLSFWAKPVAIIEIIKSGF